MFYFVETSLIISSYLFSSRWIVLGNDWRRLSSASEILTPYAQSGEVYKRYWLPLGAYLSNVDGNKFTVYVT